MWGIEPRRHVTLLSNVATCVSRNQAEGFRQTQQQHQQHPEAGSTRSEFGEVPQLRDKIPDSCDKSVSLKSLGGVKVGESSCSLQRGSETAQHGCRPEDPCDQSGPILVSLVGSLAMKSAVFLRVWMRV